jgi:hypothetical protein
MAISSQPDLALHNPLSNECLKRLSPEEHYIFHYGLERSFHVILMKAVQCLIGNTVGPTQIRRSYRQRAHMRDHVHDFERHPWFSVLV